MAETSDILKTILRRKAEEVAERVQRMPLSALERQLEGASPPRGFVRARSARIIPEWLRGIVIRLLQSLTKPTFHGPVEFFMTVMAMDMVAPKYGNKTLKAFFDELNLEEKGKGTH